MSNKLTQKFGLKEGISFVVGMVIGSGVFFKASTVFKDAGSVKLGILAWVLGGIITICAGLTIAEIASTIPKTGGLFVYLKEIYGEKIGFLFGWVQVTISSPGIVAACSIILIDQLGNLIPIHKTYIKLFAIALIFFLAFMNIFASKAVGKMQFLVTIGKLIPLFLIIGFSFFYSSNHETHVAVNSFSVNGFGSALLSTLWAYDGWIGVTTLAGEIHNPRKNVPKAIFIGLTVVICVYVLFSFALSKVLPFDTLISSTKVAEDAANLLFGNISSIFISLGILVSVFGALNGEYMAGSRVPYAMAENNIFPFKERLTKVYGKDVVPIYSLFVSSTIGIAYIITGSFETLSELVIFSLWIFFLLGVAGIFILRKKFPNANSGYKVPLYPIVPMIALIGGGYVLINTLITSPVNALTGIFITLLGLPVYYMVKFKEKNILTKAEY